MAYDVAIMIGLTAIAFFLLAFAWLLDKNGALYRILARLFMMLSLWVPYVMINFCMVLLTENTVAGYSGAFVGLLWAMMVMIWLSLFIMVIDMFLFVVSLFKADFNMREGIADELTTVR